MEYSNAKGYVVGGKNEAGDETVYSSAIVMFGSDRIAVQSINSGIATGTTTLQASLNGVDWVDVADSADTFIANESVLIERVIACSAQYRVKVALTAASAVAATGSIAGSVGTLSFAADTAGLAGNSIEVILVDGGTAGSETVGVVGSVITVDIETGVSTAAQIKTAIDNDVDAAALVDTTASVAGAMEADSVTLTGGLSGNSNLVVLAITK